jgi:hypothetical protein
MPTGQQVGEYLSKLKEHLKLEFQQQDILIIERNGGLL